MTHAEKERNLSPKKISRGGDRASRIIQEEKYGETLEIAGRIRFGKGIAKGVCRATNVWELLFKPASLIPKSESVKRRGQKVRKKKLNHWRRPFKKRNWVVTKAEGTQERAGVGDWGYPLGEH